MATTAITIEFDVDRLAGYTDEHLALLWHVAQANPADGFEDQTAGDIAEKIGREIIRRWLRGVEPELYRHQGRHYYAHQLRKFATYQPPADATSGSPAWHRGEWVPRGTDTPEATQ